MTVIRFIFIALLFCINLAGAGQAFEVQTVTSAKGVTAWLVEAHTVPIVSMNFSFEGGAALDPFGKEGAADLMSAMMTEGAGDLSAERFKAETTRLAMGLYFNANSDTVEGTLASLGKNRDASFALLKLVLTTPRFDGDAFARVQQLSLQSRKQQALDQNGIASLAWSARAFPGHVYGRQPAGTAASVANVTASDLPVLHKAMFNRRTLKVAVVGDIDAATLARLLDEVFGELPDTAPATTAKEVSVAPGPAFDVIDYDGPQTVVYFGVPSISGDGRDSWAAYLLSEILGGSATFARLNQSLREKSGLTYGVNYFDASAPHASFQLGSFSTANETAKQAIDLLKSELARMAQDGPTAEELRKAKAYVNGSYPLRFTTNMSISATLLSAQQRGRGTGFMQARPDKVNAVTLADIKAVAAKLLQPENQIIVMAGKPKL